MNALPVTFHPNKRRIIILALGSLTIGTLFPATMHSMDKGAWGVSGFFVLVALTLLLNLHPQCTFLKIQEDGILFSVLFRKTFLHWTDVSEFGVLSFYSRGLPYRCVGFGYSVKRQHSSISHFFSKEMTGFEGQIPGSGLYSLPPNELAELLTQYHRAKCPKEQ